MNRMIFFLVCAVFATPGGVAAQTAQDILQQARDRQLERWEGVDCFARTEQVMGHSVTTFYVKTEVETSGGGVETVFLPSDSCGLNVAGSGTGQPQKMTPEQMEAYADGLEMTGAGLSEGIGDGLEQAGMPRDLLKSMGGDPWVSPDPGTMMGGMGTFMRDAAEGQREMAREREADAKRSAESLATYQRDAELVGTETVDGRKAYRLRVDDLNQVEAMEGGQELTLNTVDVWLDQKELVALKTEIHGVIRDASGQRPVVMEQTSSDYRSVPGSNMYEAYRQTMEMKGMMSEEQKAQMAEAEKQLAEAEAQMAAMPPEQRAMMESMMGGQLQSLRSMISGGGFRTETVTTGIVVNPAPGEIAQSGFMGMPAGMPASAPAPQAQLAQAAPQSAPQPAPPGNDGGHGVLKMVQQKLTELGYETGNTDGIESTETTIAISQYQAEKGMEVTGKATPQLAGILAADAGGRTGAAPARSPEQLQAAREACLQEKIEAAQESQKKKRGFGRLMNAASRIASRTGNYDLARTTGDIYSAGATADDLAAAAEDLGITQSDIEACENPM